MLYACVPDIAFAGDKKYACDPMGIFETLPECVACIDRLHSSFGYCIYPIENKPRKNIRVEGGQQGTRYRVGYPIIGEVIYSFNVK